MKQGIGIIAGSFHREKVERMIEEARRQAKVDGLEVVRELWVPGSFEVPIVLQHLLEAEDVLGTVLLGVIERGETKHGLVMGQSVFAEVLRLELEHRKPVGIGIIGPEVEEHQIDSRLLPHAKAAVNAVAEVHKILSQ